MKQFLAIFVLPLVISLTNKEKFCNKIISLGVSTKVTNNATIFNILTCFEPSVYAMLPAENLTSDLKDCVISKSGNYYASVTGVYATMSSCIGGDTLAMLKKMGTILKPTLMPKYTDMITKLKDWIITKKLLKAKVLDNWYNWLNNQSTPAFVGSCCKKIVNSKNITQKEWTCSKDPTKGGQAFNTKLYECGSMNVPTGLF